MSGRLLGGFAPHLCVSNPRNQTSCGQRDPLDTPIDSLPTPISSQLKIAPVGLGGGCHTLQLISMDHNAFSKNCAEALSSTVAHKMEKPRLTLRRAGGAAYNHLNRHQSITMIYFGSLLGFLYQCVLSPGPSWKCQQLEDDRHSTLPSGLRASSRTFESV